MRHVLETAYRASDAFHAIADTSIVDLQDEAISRQVGELVTLARDEWRRAQSYGLSWQSDSLLSSSDFSTAGYALHCQGGYSVLRIQSTRGRLICTSHRDGSVEWCEPFGSVVSGDRIDSIQGLIARIKR